MQFYSKKRKKIQIFSNGCLVFDISNLLKINKLVNFHDKPLIFFKKSKNLLEFMSEYEHLRYRKKFF